MHLQCIAWISSRCLYWFVLTCTDLWSICVDLSCFDSTGMCCNLWWYEVRLWPHIIYLWWPHCKAWDMIFSCFSVLRMLDLQKLILGTMVGSSAPYETSPATNHYECRTPHETVRMMGYVGRKAPPPFAPKRPLVAARRACRRRCAAESATEPEGDARKGAGQALLRFHPTKHILVISLLQWPWKHTWNLWYLQMAPSLFTVSFLSKPVKINLRWSVAAPCCQNRDPMDRPTPKWPVRTVLFQGKRNKSKKKHEYIQWPSVNI